MLRTITLVAFALAATAAQAQTVFRSVMPDGSVIYGDEPAPGAKETRQITLPPSNVLTVPRPAAPAAKPAPGPAAAPGPAVTKQPVTKPPVTKPPVETPDAQVLRAEEELKTAQAALEAGRLERPGDRVGMVGGNARLSEGYFERVKLLEAAVAAAQEKLNDAYERRRYAR